MNIFEMLETMIDLDTIVNKNLDSKKELRDKILSVSKEEK